MTNIVKGYADISAWLLEDIFFKADEIPIGIATLTECRKIQVIPPSSSCLKGLENLFKVISISSVMFHGQLYP